VRVNKEAVGSAKLDYDQRAKRAVVSLLHVPLGNEKRTVIELYFTSAK
jgi:hypothetical protein